MRDAADLAAVLVLALALLAGAYWHMGQADLAVCSSTARIAHERALRAQGVTP